MAASPPGGAPPVLVWAADPTGSVIAQLRSCCRDVLFEDLPSPTTCSCTKCVEAAAAAGQVQANQQPLPLRVQRRTQQAEEEMQHIQMLQDLNVPDYHAAMAALGEMRASEDDMRRACCNVLHVWFGRFTHQERSFLTLVKDIQVCLWTRAACPATGALHEWAPQLLCAQPSRLLGRMRCSRIGTACVRACG